MQKLFYSEKIGKVYSIVPVLTAYTHLQSYFSSYYHIHPIYHMVFILAGKGDLTLDTKSIKLEPQDIILINPNEKHVFSTGGEELFYYALNFILLEGPHELKEQERLLKESYFKADNKIKLLETKSLEEVLDMRIKNAKIIYDQDKWPLIKKEIEIFHTNVQVNMQHLYGASAHMGEFQEYDRKVYDLVCNLYMKYYRDYPSKLEKVKDPIIIQIILYLEANINEKLNLNQLAEEMNYNASYMSRLFNEKMDMTISDYLSELKIKKACQFLRGSNKTITEIAHFLGYHSSQHFCRRFKSVKRMTPREYRSNIELF